MSVKQMTSDQIRADLNAILLTWPEGIPWIQADRVNALKGELKRRGEEPFVANAADVPTVTARPAAEQSDDELQAELRALSAQIGRNSKDEAAQSRFADVRYELRRRSAAGAAEAAAAMLPPSAPLPPRSIELPDDESSEDLDAKPAKASREEAKSAIMTTAAPRPTVLDPVMVVRNSDGFFELTVRIAPCVTVTRTIPPRAAARLADAIISALVDQG